MNEPWISNVGMVGGILGSTSPIKSNSLIRWEVCNSCQF